MCGHEVGIGARTCRMSAAGAGPSPPAVFGMYTEPSLNLQVYLDLIKIHKQAKSQFICSSQQNVSLIFQRSGPG